MFKKYKFLSHILPVWEHPLCLEKGLSSQSATPSAAVFCQEYCATDHCKLSCNVQKTDSGTNLWLDFRIGLLPAVLLILKYLHVYRWILGRILNPSI